MITARATRLIRVPSLRAYQDAIVAASCAGDPRAIRATAVIVPTRSAARRLRATIEDSRLAGPARAIVLPDLLTRAELYERLRANLAAIVPALDAFEREAMLLAAAHETITEGVTPPFDLRPALVREILELYDQLRRQQQAIDDFDRLLVCELEPRASTDRGAERMLRQTRFLAAAFRSYERRAESSGAADEHTLRARLLEEPSSCRYRHIVVTVGERWTDPGGLWPADFDLLARLHGLEQLTMVATEEQLAAGWRQRIGALLPEFEEVVVGDPESGASLESRVLLAPAETEGFYFSSRDREDEISDLARRLKTARRGSPGDAARLDATAIVCAQPLPYVYLARTVFGAAGIPYQCDDALPLAAEPIAAALDAVLDAVASDVSRPALIALLRSPHFLLGPSRTRVAAHAVHALDEALAGARYAGGRDRLRAVIDRWSAGESGTIDPRDAALQQRALPAAEAGAVAIDAIAALFTSNPASVQLGTLHDFLTRFGAPPPDDDEREWRARSAVVSTLERLASAHARHGDMPWSVEDLSATVRRWLEAQTFTPRTGTRGVHLLDQAAARYGRFDDVHLVGLVAGEWPDRPRRNLFYSPFLLSGLGWRDDRSQLEADRAAFLDLLRLASARTSVSAFLLEQDSLAEPSVLLDELPRAGLVPLPVARDSTLVSTADALVAGVAHPTALDEPAATWLRLRAARSSSAAPAFRGAAAAHRPQVHGVSSLELYVQCPFKYFARYVLRLPEEPLDDDGLGPRERGTFVHRVFQTFFERWTAASGGAITPAAIERAHALFGDVVEDLLPALPPGDAALERTRLLGSPVAPGLGDLVLAAEAVREVPVIARRLEDRFEGTFELQAASGVRRAAIRGIVDRIDLLGDGTLRVIDYKSSLPHKPVQLAVYAATAPSRLRGHLGREWRIGEVAYIVFGTHRGVKPLARRPSDLPQTLADAQRRVAAAIDGIESGEFPPRPVSTHLCATCAYAGVCRKDYAPATEDSDSAPAI